jgi:hypothetical protein
MLLREHGDGVVAIGQPSHAWISGQLARAWGNDRFGWLRPREEVCLAAEQHDIGMAQWDTKPTLNAETGLPHSFLEMPLDAHIELWSAAPGRMLAQSRYAALLVSMHGTALYARRDLARLPAAQEDAVRRYLDEQRALQQSLLDTLRADPRSAEPAAAEQVARNQRLIWTWDSLSLGICLNWAPTSIENVPAAGGETTLQLAQASTHLMLDPWPFASSELVVRCEGRVLHGRFDDEERMRDALDHAGWVTLEWEIRPGRSGA